MKKVISIMAGFFFLMVTGFTQTLSVISGTISNQTTKEFIPYANIGIEGTYTGAASDSAGNFEFKVPESNIGTYIMASAVGYQGFRIAMSELKNERLQIEMVPTDYNIGVVNINAQSLVLFRILKNSIGFIERNYLKGPFSEKAYYKTEIAVNSEPSRVQEAIVEISDLKGYVRESPLQAQLHRNYSILGVRRNFEIKGLADGMNQMDDLLGFDIVRSVGNVLDLDFLNSFDLSLDRVTQFEGDSVWVINYRLKEPDLSRTGDYYATAYEGKIYIAKSDYAILKNETWVKASDYSSLGRAFANTSQREWIPLSIAYDFSTTYRKGKDGYKLVYMKSNRHNSWKDKTDGGQKSENITNYLVPTEVNKVSPMLYNSRIYFTDMAQDQKIWDGFNLSVD